MTCPNRRWDCIGQHDDDEDSDDFGDCLDLPDDHDPRCLGHFGQTVDCVPCPHPRCLGHDRGGVKHLGFCEVLHCLGHEWEGGDDVTCLLGHASWCAGDGCPEVAEFCEALIGAGVTLKTARETGWTEATIFHMRDPTTPEEIDALVDVLGDVRTAMVTEAGLVATMHAEIEAAA